MCFSQAINPPVLILEICAIDMADCEVELQVDSNAFWTSSQAELKLLIVEAAQLESLQIRIDRSFQEFASPTGFAIFTRWQSITIVSPYVAIFNDLTGLFKT